GGVGGCGGGGGWVGGGGGVGGWRRPAGGRWIRGDWGGVDAPAFLADRAPGSRRRRRRAARSRLGDVRPAGHVAGAAPSHARGVGRGRAVASPRSRAVPDDLLSPRP